MRKFFVLQLIYLKRIFRKKSYIVLLLLVPLMVIGLKAVSNQESGALHILLCAEDYNDETAREIIEGLLDSSELIVYEYYEDANEARDILIAGNADAVWIFNENLAEKIDEVAAGDTDCELVTVLELEDTTSLKVSREALFSALYDKITYAEYTEYTESIFSDKTVTDETVSDETVSDGTATDKTVTDEEMRSYYEYYRQGDSLFDLRLQNGEKWEEASGGYITAPVRGMLAILTLLAGIAGMMYFRQDKENGVYDYLPERRQLTYKTVSVFWGLFPIAVVSLLSLFLSGTALEPGREILLMLIYIPACMIFCLILDGIFESLTALGVITPFIVLVTLAICPVFFGLNICRPVQCMLPAFYYLKGTTDAKWMLYGLIYTGCGIIILTAVYFVKKFLRKLMLIHGRQILR